jgi:hypothetical protein
VYNRGLLLASTFTQRCWRCLKQHLQVLPSCFWYTAALQADVYNRGFSGFNTHATLLALCVRSSTSDSAILLLVYCCNAG